MVKRAFSRKNLWENLPQGLKSTVGRVAGLLPPAFLLGRDFRQWYRFAQAADGWSAEQVRQYQLDEVRKICALAVDQSRFYKRVFSESGFSPDRLQSLEDLDRLPLIDKHTIVEHQADMLCCSPDAPGVDYVATGGSSGEPTQFLISANRSAPEFAHLAGSWSRTGYGISSTMASLRGQIIPPDRNGLHHYYDPLLRRHNYSNFYMTDDAMDRYFRHIETIGDCYLHTYPSSINMLVRYLKRSGRVPPANIKALLIGSENVYVEDRAVAEEVFGVRYYSWYGHSEKLVFAAECEHDSRYHVSPTYGYCELVDDDGNRVTTPGQTGEIVGTGFINRVMPFIRYRTGDYARLVGDHCSACGRNFMLIDEVKGHNVLEMLVAKDHSLIPWAACNVHDDTFAEVLRFQFVQHEPGKATVRVIAACAGREINKDRIADNMNQRLQGRIRFDIEVVSEIPLTTHGKSVFVDQRLDIERMISGDEK